MRRLRVHNAVFTISDVSTIQADCTTVMQVAHDLLLSSSGSTLSPPPLSQPGGSSDLDIARQCLWHLQSLAAVVDLGDDWARLDAQASSDISTCALPIGPLQRARLRLHASSSKCPPSE